jgi:MFS family permease
VALRWRPSRPLFVGLLLLMLWPLEQIIFSLGVPLPAVIACALVTGFGSSLMMILWETLLARRIPTTALSRVSAYDWMGTLALAPVGYVLAGPLAVIFGGRTVLAVGGALGIAMLGLALLPRSTRRLGYGSSAEQPGEDVGVEPGGETEVADVDALVGVVDERSCL